MPFSVCPSGDHWGTRLQLEIRWSWTPVRPSRGQTLRKPRSKVTSVLPRLLHDGDLELMRFADALLLPPLDHDGGLLTFTIPCLAIEALNVSSAKVLKESAKSFIIEFISPNVHAVVDKGKPRTTNGGAFFKYLNSTMVYLSKTSQTLWVY